MAAPTITLSNGYKLPVLGLGTWNSAPGEVAAAVKYAIDAGYRHIDGAFVYENENEVGEGVNAKIADGVIKREDVWITSKLWNCYHDPKEVRGALERTLKELKLDYLDLYLIHWPMSYQKSNELFPKDEAGQPLHENFDIVDTWREMEKLVDAGLTKSIGFSNFNIKQIDRIYENARIKPAVHQIEVHPYLLNKKVIEHCRSKNIAITAYSPLFSPGRPWATSEDRNLMAEPKLQEISKKYNKTCAQILIRYQIDIGNSVIPKSVSKERIESNFNVFDFKLTDEDIKDIESFGYTERICAMSQDKHHPEFPFTEDSTNDRTFVLH